MAQGWWRGDGERLLRRGVADGRVTSPLGVGSPDWRRPRPARDAVCRNIRPLFNFQPPVTEDEIQAAALQYVRKISGFRAPSKANEAAFKQAIDEIVRASAELLSSLETTATPRTDEVAARGTRAAREGASWSRQAIRRAPYLLNCVEKRFSITGL